MPSIIISRILRGAGHVPCACDVHLWFIRLFNGHSGVDLTRDGDSRSATVPLLVTIRLARYYLFGCLPIFSPAVLPGDPFDAEETSKVTRVQAMLLTSCREQ